MKYVVLAVSLLLSPIAYSQAVDPVPVLETVPALPAPPADYQLKKDYSYIDKTNLIAESLLQKGLKFYDFNVAMLGNTSYLTIIDFSMHASKRRLFLINMKTGDVQAMLVAAGRGSDPDGDGYATTFSNIPESNMSSLGFYLTAEEYIGANGHSMRLHGLSSTNSNVYKRAIVMHGADYVSEADNHAGRSQGCPAVDHKNIDDVIAKIKGASLIYADFF